MLSVYYNCSILTSSMVEKQKKSKTRKYKHVTCYGCNGFSFLLFAIEGFK